MILVCAPSPFRVHSHCRRAAAAPAATPTPGRQADADAAAAAPSSSPPRTANSGRRRRRRGLCRRRHRAAVVVRLFPPTSSSNTVRDDPPTPPSLLLSSFVSCVGSLLAHSVLPNPFSSSSSSLAERNKRHHLAVTLCGVTLSRGGVCVVLPCRWAASPRSCAGAGWSSATPPFPASFLWHPLCSRRSVLLAATSSYRWVPPCLGVVLRPAPVIAALIPKVLRQCFLVAGPGYIFVSLGAKGRGERLLAIQSSVLSVSFHRYVPLILADLKFKLNRAPQSSVVLFFFFPACLLFCLVFTGGAGLGELHWGGKFPHVATG